METESRLFSKPSPSSECREQLTPRQEQIRQGCQHIDLAAVLGQATQPGLLKAERSKSEPGRDLSIESSLSFRLLYLDVRRCHLSGKRTAFQQVGQ